MPDVIHPDGCSDENGDAGSLLDMVYRARPRWQADAACREHPEVDFFSDRAGVQLAAVRVCITCLVRWECQEWALSQDASLAGIWGGLTGRDRQRLRAGRPAALTGLSCHSRAISSGKRRSFAVNDGSTVGRP